MKIIKVSLLLCALLGLSACANKLANLPNNDELLKVQTEQDGKACIRADRIRAWGTLDDDVISVDAFGTQKYYLVTTMFSCTDIEISPRVAFSTSFSEFCGRGRDRILTRDNECQVKSIFEFDSREEAFATFEAVKNKRSELREEQKSSE